MTESQQSADQTTWKITIISPINFLASLEETVFAASGDYFPSITDFEIEDDPENRLLEIYYDHQPNINLLENSISEMAAIFKISAPEIKLEQLENKDWVALSQKILKPIDAGRFYLYGSHDFDTVPDDKLSILMEAGQAFGTGSHETTKGCLLAISDLYEKITPKTVLDLGCGSGVLAIAMAKQWNTKIVASDIDPIATDTTKENILANDLDGIKVVTCDGINNSELNDASPYDLIVANILAEPLKIMAADIASNLIWGGYLVLSGLLKEQQALVVEVYAGEGMELEQTFPINEWQTLLLRKI